MLAAILSVALMAAAQDKPPLAGTLPPMPPPLPREEPRSHNKLFISPMGEPFRGPDPVRMWFDGADTDHDESISANEFVADAMRFFAVLDRGKDGEIDPDDIEYYETVLAPEIRTGGEGAGPMHGARSGGGNGSGRRGGGGGGGRRGGGGGGGGPGGMSFGNGGSGEAKTPRYADTKRGAARYSFFDYPEPVVVADTNFNRGVDPQEFRAAALDRFAMLDKNHDGRITRGELPRIDPPIDEYRPRRGGLGRRPGMGGQRPDGDDSSEE
ncbi:MAG: EF-hand domain-containing protein [Sphingomonas sp.]|uniref:EF-hand domain-containing protein n=1 Tax=Sphingomonas sp. TaxID=28214 RepID=UPI00120423C7|nr:EF-hand domain-containing protein [Sphingomonas sp.]THD37482.1 MAG: EF-hand domain-containing protein [Sphingomonas sp.]